MPVGPGSRLGPYEVIALIGAGGMGEVYRATDTHLGRQVAIKVLPTAFAEDADSLARLEREAKTLASLNHPNIAIIHGLEKADGIRALVMELVEGPTLADRIAQGPIPVDEALPIAKQIAEALEAAHEQGIIHRDLKPANIKVRPDGTVKVLDFGLAKALEPNVKASADATASPTITSPAMMTGVGMLLGTAAYMSPEQARGKAVDKRSDIWAFGCVLYEMLTGRRAFEGDDLGETLANVIKADVPWEHLPTDTPPAIRRLLRRCLSKDPMRRLDSATVAGMEIHDALGRVDVETQGHPPRITKTRLAWIGAVALAAAAAGVATWALKPEFTSAASIVRVVIPLPQTDAVPANIDAASLVALSPDGSTLVYVASRNGTRQLFRRDLSTLDALPIPGTDDANYPVFSPDGQSIAFVRGLQIQAVSTVGGGIRTIFEGTPPNLPTQLSWGTNGTIVFGLSGIGDGLMQVPATGGTASQLTALDQKAGETDHRFPHALPGGEALLFTAWFNQNSSAGLDAAQIVAQVVATGERRTVIAGSSPRVTPSGHLLFTREDGLWVAPFSVERLEVTGTASRVSEPVSTFGTGNIHVALSGTGSLAYVLGPVVTPQRILTWVDRSGVEELIGVPPRNYVTARLSPDGTQIALDVRDQQSDIWVWNMVRQTLTRLTVQPGIDMSPVWTPDGRRIAFASQLVNGQTGIFWQPADGAGAPELLSSPSDFSYPTGFSPDGMWLLFQPFSAERGIAALNLNLERRSEFLLQTPFDESNAQVSPDGRWLAYQSNESGRIEVYVRPFSNPTSRKWQISTNGGVRPMWGRDGRSLLYVTDPVLTLVEVSVQPGVTFVPGRPAVVIKGPNGYVMPGFIRPYDVTADGRRFLMLKNAVSPDQGKVQQIVLVQNWTEELKRLVPTP